MDMVSQVKQLAKQSLFERKFPHLKDKNISAIVCGINKQRVYRLSQGNGTEITRFMTDYNDLNLVKSALDEINNLFIQYQNVHCEYVGVLTSTEDQERETESYEKRETSILDLRKRVEEWISLTEYQLSDHLDESNGAKGSKGTKSLRTQSSHSSTSSVSSRTKERVKVDELLAEKAMLRCKQALDVATEDLRLDTEIAKAQAREYGEFEGYEENIMVGQVEVKVESHEPVDNIQKDVVALRRQSAKPTSSIQTTHPRDLYTSPVTHQSKRTLPMPVLSVSSLSDLSSPPRPPQHEPDKCLDPATKEFHPSVTHEGNHQPTIQPVNMSTIYGSPDQDPPENSMQHFMMLQQRNNEAMMAANFQLAAAMYNSFIKAFDARIESKIANSADRLYYLNQHLVGEPKELIGGCLYLEAELGYVEARKLLENEYGDTFKISTAYVNKVLSWLVIKYDDELGLKRFALFLKKVKNAMGAITQMTVFNHPTNMQMIVRKLPPNLQNKWRDRVTNMKRDNRKVAQFQNLVSFVDECTESANHPIYGKRVLGFRRVDDKDNKKSGRNSSSFATKVEVTGERVVPGVNRNHVLVVIKPTISTVVTSLRNQWKIGNHFSRKESYTFHVLEPTTSRGDACERRHADLVVKDIRRRCIFPTSTRTDVKI